jgi:prophage tail gpP-like protein
MPVKIQFRRGTAAEWTSANPTLLAGELGLETDTNKFKIGNGATAWTSLSYSSLPSDALSLNTIDAKGDLLVGTADNTAGRLAVGSNGQILTANSSTASGLEWATNNAASTGKAIAMAFVFG